MAIHVLNFLPWNQRRKIAAFWRTCFVFPPSNAHLQTWIDHNARRYTTEQIIASCVAALRADNVLAEAAARQLYIHVGKAIADLWNEARNPIHLACSNNHHKNIVSLLRIIDAFNTQQYNFALRCLALSGPCPAITSSRVERLVAKVWAWIGKLRVTPSTRMLEERVWAIECSCNSGVHRLWERLVFQYLDGEWDDFELGENGYDVIYEYFLFTVCTTEFTPYHEQQVECIFDMVQLFL